MIYNIGVNTHVILYGGTFNRKKINLDEKAAFNFQGTGAVQWIIGIPLMILPMIIFGLINWVVSFEIAVAVLAVLGFIGIALHKKLMQFITKKYKVNKYVMIHAFNQEN
jgi:membrane protein YdbS with pleckstrin-like domain